MQRVQKMFSGTGSVFWVTAALSAALIVWGMFFTGNFTAVVTATFEFIIANLSWFYMVVTSLFLGFCIWLAFSRYGKIR
ncbi:MAG: BCCT family transporter, partial [Actinomycetota bacterium]|nr:BCCT family transporter [Actinomycetota bacterium]